MGNWLRMSKRNGPTAASALFLVVLALAPIGHAQSFSCAAARSDTERRICNDKELAGLDESAAAAFLASGQAAPQLLPELQLEQRRWLAYRDDHCRLDPTKSGDQFTECLRDAYRTRIDDLQWALSEKTVGQTAGPACRGLARQYRGLAPLHVGESPLEVLQKAPAPVFALGKESVELGMGAGPFMAWAKQQSPPLALDDERARILTQGLVGNATLVRLPTTNFYSLLSYEGNRNCLHASHFEIRDAMVQIATGVPKALLDDGSGNCYGDKGRYYGQVAEVPVIVEDGFSPQGATSTLTVWSWGGSGFAGACRVVFSFQKRVGPLDSSSNEAQCKREDCALLEAEAVDLVRGVENGGTVALVAEYARRIPPGAKAKADALMKRELRSLGLGTSISAYLDKAGAMAPGFLSKDFPLVVPFVRDQQPFLAVLWHLDLGGIPYSDWNVDFKELRNGTLAPATDFVIAVGKGALEKVSIAPLE